MTANFFQLTHLQLLFNTCLVSFWIASSHFAALRYHRKDALFLLKCMILVFAMIPERSEGKEAIQILHQELISIV
jgi:hypothetical protein